MLSINETAIIGQCFTVTDDDVDPNTHFECLGYGQDVKTSANYVFGSCWDQPSNRTIIQSFLIKNVTFIGKLPKPIVK